MKTSMRFMFLFPGRMLTLRLLVCFLHRAATRKFTYEELVAPRAPEIDAVVDPTRVPLYLSESDMQERTGCTAEDYMKLPDWKKAQVRKKCGLF